MFCPKCGTTPSDSLNYCNSCGANLQGVRQALVSGKTTEEFSWGKTWLAEMFLSGSELKLRKEELERRRGITPEIKRIQEIKTGMITASAGLAGMIALFVLMQGLVLGADVPAGVAAILSRIWIVGLIPLMIGIGLVVHAIGAKKWIGAGAPVEPQSEFNPMDGGVRSALPAPTTGALNAPPSVTEGTTRHLEESNWKQ